MTDTTPSPSSTLPPTEPPSVNQDDFENLQLAFYIAAGVYGGVILILLVIIIVLCIKIKGHQKQLVKVVTLTTTQGRSLKPDEELSKRYVMSMEDNPMARPPSVMMDNPQHRRHPDILRSKAEMMQASAGSMMRHTKKPNELYY